MYFTSVLKLKNFLVFYERLNVKRKEKDCILASVDDGLVYNVSITLNTGSPSPSAERNGIHLKPSKNSSVPAFHTTDSGSNPSSCNSSTPSSPTTNRYTPSPANTQNLTTFTFPGKQIKTGVEIYVLYP